MRNTLDNYTFTVVGYELISGKTYAYSIHTTRRSAGKGIIQHRQTKEPAIYWIEEH